MYDNALKKIYDGDKLLGMNEIAKTFNINTFDNDVINSLYDIFVSPNLETFNENYIKNTKLLKDYPYIFNKNFQSLENNTFILFPIDENIFYEYNKFSCTFEKIEVNSTRETKYFFEFLDNPLLVENEFNELNLNFLVDNVRASEDVAYENHIYLYYDNIRVFSKLLYYCDFEPLLKDQKVVFLFDREKSKYPIDFKEKFGVDYDSMEFHEVRPSEVKRLIVQTHMFSSSGTEFIEEVIDWHPNILIMSSYEVGFGIYNHNLSIENYINIVKKSIEDKQIQNLDKTLNAYTLIFNGFKDDETAFIEYFNKFVEICEKYNVESKRDWLVASYLAISKKYNKDLSSRITPIVHHKVHYVATINNESELQGIHSENFYKISLPFYESFKYFYSYNPVRDPITACASHLRLQLDYLFKGTFNYDYISWWFQNFNFMQHNFSSVSHNMESKRFFKFENLKMNPKATMASMCKFFNIQYSENLEICSKFGVDRYKGKEKSEAVTVYFNEEDSNKIVDGFSVFSVYDENLDNSVYSDFDIKRLELGFYPVFELIGYKPQEHDYTEYSDQEIMKMFEQPFEFEKKIIELYPKDKKFKINTNQGKKVLNVVQYNSYCRYQLALSVINYRKMVKYQIDNNLLNTYPVLEPDERYLVNPIYTNVKTLPKLDNTNVSFL